jgi:hypothetical protein
VRWLKTHQDQLDPVDKPEYRADYREVLKRLRAQGFSGDDEWMRGYPKYRASRIHHEKHTWCVMCYEYGNGRPCFS